MAATACFEVSLELERINLKCIGDNPLSDTGHGPPVDALDKVCKAYKDCLKCARMTYGDQCINDFIEYSYGLGQDEIVCRDDPNSCDRAICECDAMFARHHVGATGAFDSKYHMFLSVQGWDPVNDSSACPTSGF